jgi:hypothetical protein
VWKRRSLQNWAWPSKIRRAATWEMMIYLYIRDREESYGNHEVRRTATHLVWKEGRAGPASWDHSFICISL